MACVTAVCSCALLPVGSVSVSLPLSLSPPLALLRAFSLKVCLQKKKKKTTTPALEVQYPPHWHPPAHVISPRPRFNPHPHDRMPQQQQQQPQEQQEQQEQQQRLHLHLHSKPPRCGICWLLSLSCALSVALLPVTFYVSLTLSVSLAANDPAISTPRDQA